MSNSTSTGGQNQQSDKARTEADKNSVTGGKDKSSHDEKSRAKAGTDSGAGGGAKQQQQH